MTPAALLVLARCSGFMFRAPGFSHPNVPPIVRAGLALFLTVTIAPAVKPLHEPAGYVLIAAIAAEAALGAAIGFAAGILYDGAYAGGRALDDYVGIRGSVPRAQVYAASAFGRVWSTLFTAGFFLLGGYRMAITAFSRSFSSVPPGSFPSPHQWYSYALTLPVTIIQAALLVAGPAIALAFATHITLGALMRVIPRFATFTLSFPVVFCMALLATFAAIPLLLEISGSPWLGALPLLTTH